MPDGTNKLIIDGAEMARLLRSPAGPVGRHLILRATLVQARAKQILGPHRKSGCLEDTIVKRAEIHDGDLAIRIQSDTTSCSPERKSYSLIVHEGSEPHDILPRSPGGVLAFQVGGQTVFARSVHHPGTAPIPFLRDALPLAIAP